MEGEKGSDWVGEEWERGFGLVVAVSFHNANKLKIKGTLHACIVVWVAVQ